MNDEIGSSGIHEAGGIVSAYAYGGLLNGLTADQMIEEWIEAADPDSRLFQAKVMAELLGHFAGLFVRELAEANGVTVAEQLRRAGIGSV